MKFLSPVEAARQLPERHITIFAHAEGQPAEPISEALRTLGRTVTLHEITFVAGGTQPRWLPPTLNGREKHFSVISPTGTRTAGLGFALLSTIQQQRGTVLAVPHPSYPEPNTHGELSDAEQQQRELGVVIYDGALIARDRASQQGYPLWLVIAGENGAFDVVSPLVTDTSEYTFRSNETAAML